VQILASCYRKWARLLRPLYGMSKHEPLHVWGCSGCGKVIDVQANPEAGSGWNFDKDGNFYCQECMEAGAAVDKPVDLEELRTEFRKKIFRIKHGGKQ
jgi:hypothetical protein